MDCFLESPLQKPSAGLGLRLGERSAPSLLARFLLPLAVCRSQAPILRRILPVDPARDPKKGHDVRSSSALPRLPLAAPKPTRSQPLTPQSLYKTSYAHTLCFSSTRATCCARGPKTYQAKPDKRSLYTPSRKQHPLRTRKKKLKEPSLDLTC